MSITWTWWRHPSMLRPRRQLWLRTGLLLMGTGSLLGLAYIGEKAVYVFTQPASLPPPFSSDHGCRSLLSPPQCAFSVTLPITAVFLAAIGATLPVWGAALATPLRSYRNRRAFRTLGPLREDLHGAFPDVALHEPGDGSPWDLAFRLYRRLIEIQDGRLLLRPYTSEAVTTLATQVAAERGVRGEELRAVVEAAETAAALRARRAGTAVTAPLPEHAAPDSDDVLRETAWLTKVARAYTSSPVVRELVIPLEEEATYPERPEPAL